MMLPLSVGVAAADTRHKSGVEARWMPKKQPRCLPPDVYAVTPALADTACNAFRRLCRHARCQRAAPPPPSPDLSAMRRAATPPPADMI